MVPMRITWSVVYQLSAVASTLILVGVAAVAFNSSYARPQPKLMQASLYQPPPPVFDVMQRRIISVLDAKSLNAAIPLETVGPQARPFVVPVSSEAYGVAAECLTRAIYYEAASEPDDGKRAVAQVVLNRVRHPAFPNSICDVVNQGSNRATGCQFTFMCDGSLNRKPQTDVWMRSRRIAVEALNGAVYPPVGMATHYHADWVLPYWADSVTKVATVGAHIFYRWSGGWGTRNSFTQRYSGMEHDQRVASAPDSPLLQLVDVTSESTSIADPPKSKGMTPSKSTQRDRFVLVADSISSGLKSDLQEKSVLLADSEASPRRSRDLQDRR